MLGEKSNLPIKILGNIFILSFSLISMKKAGKKEKSKKIPEKEEKPREETKKTLEKEEVRVSTGVKNFDELVEGGFEKDSANLLVGESGSGKSIFAVQFLVDGIKKGEKCLYITFEENKKEFYHNMLEFGWDLEKYEKEGKFVFLEYTPEKVKTMLEEGGGIVESIVRTKKIARIVIDSVTSFELLFEEDIEKREAALSLFNMLGKWNCTSLLTYEGEPFRDKDIASHTLEFEVDSIILLYFVRGKAERERYIEVLKMRGTKHSRRIHQFTIEKSGIVINKNPYSDGIKFP